MLENNFTPLDNDFITYWSRFILQWQEEPEVLEKLAELGQVNAMQSYYLVNKDCVPNAVIEENAKALPQNNFNNQLVLAHRAYMKENDKITRASQELEDDLLKRKDIIQNSGVYYTYEEEQRLRFLNENISSNAQKLLYSNFGCGVTKSLTSTFELFKATQNPLVLERFCEVASGTPEVFIGAELSSLGKKAQKSARKLLMEKYKQEKDPQTEFALGKNLIFFEKTSKKLRLFGVSLLENLAKREYSEQLQSYNLQGQTIQKPRPENTQTNWYEDGAGCARRAFKILEKTGFIKEQHGKENEGDAESVDKALKILEEEGIENFSYLGKNDKSKE